MIDVQKKKSLFQHEETALENHKKMSRLFKENRFLFELKRKKAIEEVINNAPTEERKLFLKDSQQKWDQILKSSGSADNRFVLIQMLFWNQVNEQFNPGLERFKAEMGSYDPSITSIKGTNIENEKN
jgi:hypothetical protein